MDLILYWTLIVIISLMVISVTWQVFTRYILGSSSPITEELSTFMLIWMTLLGSAYAIRQQAHIGIDVITRKFRAENHVRSRYFIYVSIIVFAIFALIIGGVRLVYVTLLFNQTSAALQIPMGYVYMILPLSGIIMIFYSVAEISDLYRSNK